MGQDLLKITKNMGQNYKNPYFSCIWHQMTKYGNSVPDPSKIDIFFNFWYNQKGRTCSFSECPQPLSGDNFKQIYEILPFWAMTFYFGLENAENRAVCISHERRTFDFWVHPPLKSYPSTLLYKFLHFCQVQPLLVICVKFQPERTTFDFWIHPPLKSHPPTFLN